MASSSSLRVAVLGGGHGSEHVISLQSAGCLLAGVRQAGCDALAVVISTDGAWHLLDDDRREFPGRADGVPPGARMSGQPLDVVRELRAAGVEVVVLGLHGPGGEDGVLQGFLETCGLRYTGCGVGASALAADKGRFKHLLEGAGLATPAFIEVGRHEWDGEAADRSALLDEILDDLQLPLIVKPQLLGSSVGIRPAAERAELEEAITQALEADLTILVEERIAGREFTCAVIGPSDMPETFPVVEIVPRNASWFDYSSKYDAGGADEIVPADIPAALEAILRDLATRVHGLLHAHGTTRTDFIVDQEGRPWILETNTLPGMTRASLFPRAAAAAGWDMSDLAARLVSDALSR